MRYCFPLLSWTRYLHDRFQWTMRIIGFILLVILGIGNLVSLHFLPTNSLLQTNQIYLKTVARRFPPVRVAGGLWNLAAFKSRPYSIYCASGLVAFLGLYTGTHTYIVINVEINLYGRFIVLTYIDISANSIGISPDFSFYLIAIANAASGVGRLIFGKLSDRYGSFANKVTASPCWAFYWRSLWI